jgi:hypothetical protein
MKRVSRGSIAISAATLLALLIPAAGTDARAKRKHRNGPDLVVTHVIPDTGSVPDYLIEQPNGDLSDMNVDVTVRNVGNRKAAKSILKVKIYLADGRLIATGYADIPALKAGHQHTATLGVATLKLILSRSLQPLHIVATANYNLVAPETHYTNNSRMKGNIPVIADQWSVTKWTAFSTTTASGLSFDNTNHADAGMIFKYTGFDSANHIFDYEIKGGITQDTVLTTQNCSGSGHGSASHSTWPEPLSSFATDYSQTHYAATVYTKNESPYSFNYTCTNGQHGTANIHFFDLVTASSTPGPQSTSPGKKTLSGSGTIARGFSSITYNWQFDADVP